MNKSAEPKDNLIDRIGVAGRFPPGEYEKVIALACEAGFECFELSVGQFGATEPGWPRTLLEKPETKDRLRDRLGSFSRVIIRATEEGLNIASINPGQRSESIRQYLESLDLARDLGAEVVSFQPGGPTPGFVSDPRDIVDKNIAFAKQALKLPGSMNMVFQSVGIGLPEMEAVMAGLDSDVFGVDLWAGALAAQGGPPANEMEPTNRVLTWIDTLTDRIKLVHLSGVHQRWHADRLAGCPFEMNNALNLAAVVHRLTDINFPGPIILDIQAPNPAQTLHYCKTAREELQRIYSESPRKNKKSCPSCKSCLKKGVFLNPSGG